jgi:hypothetical protein
VFGRSRDGRRLLVVIALLHVTAVTLLPLVTSIEPRGDG